MLVEYEKKGLAVFGISKPSLAKSKLYLLASQCYPDCYSNGLNQLEASLKDIVRKLSLLAMRPDSAIRLERGFEQAVFMILHKNGMKICADATINSDPGGLLLCGKKFKHLPLAG